MNRHVLPGSTGNILDVWHRATPAAVEEGELWYVDAFSIATDLASDYATTPAIAAGVLAVLSPQLSWAQNVEAARQHFEQGWTPLQTRANNDKAGRITYGDLSAISGPKVTAFYNAIVDPYGDTPPVIDRHAVAVYCGRTISDAERKRKLKRSGVIPRIQRAYVRAASVLASPVHTVQAVTWVQWRNETMGLHTAAA